MRRILINFCAFCLLVPGIGLFAQNNLNVIDSLVNEITIEILDAGKNEFNKNVILQIGKFNGNKTGYLRSKIGNILTENNYQVFRNFPKDTSFESTVLEVQNFEIGIDYSEPFSESMMDVSMVQRMVLVEIEGQIYNNQNKKIILPVQTENKFIDKIVYNSINKMEESPYVFTHGTKAGLSSWQQFLEPALVVSSVLAVLLLLFTQRS